MAPDGTLPALRPRHLPAVGLIVTATFIAFLPALSAGFVNWDDDRTILENRAIAELSWANVQWMFTHHFMGHYQPLALLTLAFDYSLWGLEAFGYHLTNVVLHLLNTVLFYFLAARLLRMTLARPAGEGHTSLPSGEATSAVVLGATAATILSAMHPLRVESVAWVTERRDVLSAFFYLAATLAYLKAHDTTDQGSGHHAPFAGRQIAFSPRFWLLASVAFVLLSLLCKVIAVTAVGVFLLLDWYPLGRLGGERGFWSPAARRVWAEKVLFVLPAILFGLVTIRAQAESASWRGVEATGALKPALGGLFSLSFYIWKTIWPVGMSPYYEMPLHAADIDLRFVIGGVLVLAAAVPLLIWRRRHPGLLVAWGCYLVLVFPVLGAFQNWPQVAADRYTYLPCMAWALLLGAAVARCMSLASGKNGRPPSLRRVPGRPLQAAMAIVAIGLGALTWRQNRVWWNSFTLWERVLAVEPDNYFARLNYGEAMIAAGRWDEALVQSTRAVELRPDDCFAHTNQGLALLNLRRYPEAARSLRTALQLNPGYAKAHTALGLVLTSTGGEQEGMDHLSKAVALDPNDPGPRAILGHHLHEKGQLDLAIEQFEAASHLSPANADIRRELAEILQKTHRSDQAMKVLREGLVYGRDPGLLDALARLLATCEDPAFRNANEAVRLAQEASQAPEQRPARLETLAEAYLAAGQTTEAVKTLEAAVKMAQGNNDEAAAQRCRSRLAQLQKAPQ